MCSHARCSRAVIGPVWVMEVTHRWLWSYSSTEDVTPCVP